MRTISFCLFAKAVIAAAIVWLLSSCQKINNALEAGEISYLTLNIVANSALEEVTSTAGLRITFQNHAEGSRIERTLQDGVTAVDSIIPGIYSINISGTIETDDGIYYIKGSKPNYYAVRDQERIEIEVDGIMGGTFAFSEVYYAGSPPFYFRDQFYEITNNSEETVYADGLYFARLVPISPTTSLPTWPEEDGNRFVYTDRLWRVPGHGTQYPVKPGASFIIAQFAANHRLAQYNPESPVDCSTAEFEFNMDNPNFPDQPATDMEHIFLNGTSAKGSTPQYLTSVGGSALVIFKAPAGEEYDPVNDPRLRTPMIGSTSSTLYAKIPVKYVIDGIEAGLNETMITGKRMPAVLDAGMTFVDGTYNALSVRRKKIDTRPDGTPILMDTNNSLDDFERKVAPRFRAHGQGVPSWSSANK